MAALADRAQAGGVVLLHENEKEIFGDVPERVHHIATSVASPALRLAWDAANYVQCGVVPFPEAYELLRPYTDYIQIKDAVLGTGEVVPAGEGDGRVRETMRALADDGFDGFSPWSRTWRQHTTSEGSPGPRTSSAPPRRSPGSSMPKASPTDDRPPPEGEPVRGSLSLAASHRADPRSGAPGAGHCPGLDRGLSRLPRPPRLQVGAGGTRAATSAVAEVLESSDPADVWGEAHRREFLDFVDAVNSGRTLLVDGFEGPERRRNF
jgi:hypothetical protein